MRDISIVLLCLEEMPSSTNRRRNERTTGTFSTVCCHEGASREEERHVGRSGRNLRTVVGFPLILTEYDGAMMIRRISNSAAKAGYLLSRKLEGLTAT